MGEIGEAIRVNDWYQGNCKTRNAILYRDGRIEILPEPEPIFYDEDITDEG